jgi:hypothetical protein
MKKLKNKLYLKSIITLINITYNMSAFEVDYEYVIEGSRNRKKRSQKAKNSPSEEKLERKQNKKFASKTAKSAREQKAVKDLPNSLEAAREESWINCFKAETLEADYLRHSALQCGCLGICNCPCICGSGISHRDCEEVNYDMHSYALAMKECLWPSTFKMYSSNTSAELRLKYPFVMEEYTSDSD